MYVRVNNNNNNNDDDDDDDDDDGDDDDDDDDNNNNNNNNNNNDTERCNSRYFFPISSLCHELSPTHMLKWPVVGGGVLLELRFAMALSDYEVR